MVAPISFPSSILSPSPCTPLSHFSRLMTEAQWPTAASPHTRGTNSCPLSAFIYLSDPTRSSRSVFAPSAIVSAAASELCDIRPLFPSSVLSFRISHLPDRSRRIWWLCRDFTLRPSCWPKQYIPCYDLLLPWNCDLLSLFIDHSTAEPSSASTIKTACYSRRSFAHSYRSV